MAPMVTTAMSLGSTSRDTMVCRASTMLAAGTMGSTATCGIAPWPPTPLTVSTTVSDELYMTPARNPK
ncbi:hypothetical protein G6F24_018930 [Rhizopus arrhizus]|nr:hypothetical protein G6F24_018930 [Rhizopus arrhizus]